MDVKTTAKLAKLTLNVFFEIKFLICIQEIPFVKFAIFEAQFPKVSSLEIFSPKNISQEGNINLTNEKGLHAQKTEKHLWHAISIQYAVIISRNRLSHYKYKSTLNSLDRISIEKKADSDDR